MQNTIQKFWQSFVVLRNQVFCLKIWKVSRALTILQFDIFCWNFAHVFYLLMSTIECVGFLKVYLDLELFGKIRKDLVSTHSFFTLLSITQDLNKIKKITHIWRWGTPQNFLLAFIDKPWKPKKVRILKKWKNSWIYHHFTHVYQKPQSYVVQFLRYRVRQVFFCHFGPFFALWPS